jgi:hypothetical protein
MDAEEGLPLPRGVVDRLAERGQMVDAGVEFWDHFDRRRQCRQVRGPSGAEVVCVDHPLRRV